MSMKHKSLHSPISKASRQAHQPFHALTGFPKVGPGQVVMGKERATLPTYFSSRVMSHDTQSSVSKNESVSGWGVN